MKTSPPRSLLVAALLLPSLAAAQTAPAGGWREHVRACLPDQASGRTHLNNIPERSGSLRFTAVRSAGTPGTPGAWTQTWTVAAWRVECPNNPAFPLLALRTLSVAGVASDLVGLRLDGLGAVVQQGASTRFSLGYDNEDIAGPNGAADSLRPSGGHTVVVAHADNPGFVVRDAFTISGGTVSGTLSFPATGPGANNAGPWPLVGRLSGTYFDPARSGEGILVDFSRLSNGNDHVFFSWYTYDDVGNQLWIVGSTAYPPGVRSVRVPLLVTRGGRFGAAFRAEDVHRTPWGEATLSFPDCSTAVMEWTRTATGERGTYRMARIGEGPAGSGCY